MRNRYYMSYVKDNGLWNIIDYRTRKVIYESDKLTCMSILEDLAIASKDNVNLETLIKEKKQ